MTRHVINWLASQKHLVVSFGCFTTTLHNKTYNVPLVKKHPQQRPKVDEGTSPSDLVL